MRMGRADGSVDIDASLPMLGLCGARVGRTLWVSRAIGAGELNIQYSTINIQRPRFKRAAESQAARGRTSRLSERSEPGEPSGCVWLSGKSRLGRDASPYLSATTHSFSEAETLNGTILSGRIGR